MINNIEYTDKNNNVILTGSAISPPLYSHEIFGEHFYIFEINVPRTSGIIDVLPIMISDRMYNIEKIKIGNSYKIIGQFRSYNQERPKRHVALYTFAMEMYELEDAAAGENCLTIEGYICKEPVHRQTPLGREITELLVAVNRAYGKTDYIPCITWGRNAKFASFFETGLCVKLEGRIQSRKYTKRINANECEVRTTFELSANKLVVCENNTLN